MGKKSLFFANVAEYKVVAGRHNLRSFLAANSTQNYFLIAHMIIFCDIRDKSAVFNILRQNETIFKLGNGQRGRKKKEMKRVNLSPFPHSLSISSSFSYSFSIFLQPGCQAAASCATLIKTVNHKVTMIFPEYFLFSIYSFLNLSDQTIRSQILLDIFPSRTSNRYLIDPAHHLIY